MDLNNIINNVIEYKYLSTKKDLVHIGYGIDNNYVRCAATSMVSFYLNNKNRNFSFYIITNNLSNENKDFLYKDKQKATKIINNYIKNRKLLMRESLKSKEVFNINFKLKNMSRSYYYLYKTLCK